jgi:hypothetical protein
MELSQVTDRITKNTERRPPLLLSGLDSLYVSYYLDLAKGGIDFEELSYSKERLKAYDRKTSLRIFPLPEAIERWFDSRLSGPCLCLGSRTPAQNMDRA